MQKIGLGKKMNAICPGCGYKFRVPKQHFGKETKCQSCYLWFKPPPNKKIGDYIVASVFFLAILIFFTIGFSASKWSKKGTWSGQNHFAKKSIKGDDNEQKAHEKRLEYYSGITFEDFDAVYRADAMNGKPSKGKIKAEHVGKTIRWTGYVTDIGISSKTQTCYASFKHRSSSKSNVTVFFLNSQIEKLKEVNKGDLVTYSGIIASSAKDNLNHMLKQGRIIQIKHQ